MRASLTVLGFLLFGTGCFILGNALPANIVASTTEPATIVNTEQQNAEQQNTEQQDENDRIVALGLLASIGVYDVDVVVTDDPELNCGRRIEGAERGGCFRGITPDRIYVSPGLEMESLKSVVFHEYAHVEQYQTGQPLLECEADARAIELGADPALAYYTSEGSACTEPSPVSDS